MTRGECRWSRGIAFKRAIDGPRQNQKPLHDILERIRSGISGPVVSVDTIVRTMDVSLQPVFLVLPALILVSPLSGIPGLSSLGGLTIALVALQILLGRQVIWLPDFVLRRQVSADRLKRALARLDRPAAFIDQRSVTRMEWMLAFPGRQLALTTCLLCGLAMPFLELVPFSATTLAVVVSILASALLVRDGVLAALGLGAFGLAVFIVTKLAVT